MARLRCARWHSRPEVPAAEHLGYWSKMQDVLVKYAIHTQIRRVSRALSLSHGAGPRWRWRGLRSRVAGRSGEPVERRKRNGKVDSDGSFPKRKRKIAAPTE